MKAGIYIHIPFCLAKCSYCDFFSMPASDEEIQGYINCLTREIKLSLPKYSDKIFDTIFIGGGTPSILKPEQLEQIFNALFSIINSSDIIECSLEANPETLTKAQLTALNKLPISRLSIGIQSTSNKLLNIINRPHTWEKAKDSLNLARKAGFSNINTDIIFGLPGQSLEDWQKSLQDILSLKPEHISAYNLSLEDNTPLKNKVLANELVLPDEDTQIEIMRTAIKYLTQNSYRHYEISNYSLPGYECKHNLKYWQGDDFLGFGAGAHSFINGKRFFISPDICEYIKAVKQRSIPYENEDAETERQKIAEQVMMGLRLIDGIDINDFQSKFNVNIVEFYKQELPQLVSDSMIELKDNKLRLTSQGLLLANEIIEKFF